MMAFPLNTFEALQLGFDMADMADMACVCI